MFTHEDFERLFEQGLSYRHSEERWHALQDKSGPRMRSPFRSIRLGNAWFVEEMIQPTIEPFALSEAEVRALRRIAAAWKEFTRVQFDIVRDGLLGSDNACAAFAETAVSPAERALALRDPGYATPIAPFVRLDMIRTGSGFKVIDINVTRPAGMGDYALLDGAYRDCGFHFDTLGVFARTMQECFDGWQARRGSVEAARVGILIDADAGDWHNFRILGESLAREKWVESAQLFSEIGDPALLPYNLILRSRVKAGHPQFERLAALPPERVAVVTPVERRFLGNKLWFVAFRTPPFSERFCEALGVQFYGALNEAFPVTGTLDASGMVTFPHGKEHISTLPRKEWIVKPPSGSSGHGVVIGANLSGTKWQGFCTSPAAAGGIVQEHFNVKEEARVFEDLWHGCASTISTISGHTKYGLFVCGGEVAGCEVMFRERSMLVHGARDTYFSTCVW